MGTLLSSITLSTAQLPNMLAFYRALGVLFEETRVDKGSRVYRSVISGVEFTIYETSSQEKRSRPELQLSFKVPNLESLFLELKILPGVHAILDPTPMADGKKAIVFDPDGHSIELKEV